MLIRQTTFKDVSATVQHSYFDQKSEEILQTLQFKVKTSKYIFVNYSITDAKLFFETPTQLSMMIDDTGRLVCLHFVERKS